MLAHSDQLTQYIEFCASPLRDKASIEAEYYELCRNPNIKFILLHKPHILALGTSPLIIPWQGVEYEIGEFIIFFIRKRVGRVWETGFRFTNINNAVEIYDKQNILQKLVMHPHIISKKYEDIEAPTGDLCISAGQFAIYQSLRKGLINRAFSHLWTALRLYDTGMPFFDVEDWPLLLKEAHHD
jgi:hypothetical protein